jgi:hypothetical protein
MVVTGNGGTGPGTSGDLLMVANSRDYHRRDRSNMSKTNSLTPEQNLQILQEAIRRCQLAGIDIRVSPFYGGGRKSTVLIIDNVILEDNSLKIIEIASNGTV